MLFKDISILDENFELQKNMYVGIKDNKIVYISNDTPDEEYGEIINGQGKLLMSGFYNSHAHSPMTLMRGYGENLSLMDWLNNKIFPFEEKLDGNSVYWGTMLAIAESFKYGIVSTTDMYYFCEDIVKAIETTGAKNNISRGITNFTDSDLWELDSYKESKELFEKYNNAFGERIKVDMCIHAEYTSNKKTVNQLVEFAKKINSGMHIHLSETKFEHEECKKKYNMTPTQYFEKSGMFDLRTTAAHCIWLEEDDMSILKENNVTVAVNPFSNLKLASGVCNVPKLLERKINVTIGTDSVASNNSLNFFEEIKTFATLSKGVFGNPKYITPIEALHSATKAGAISQGRNDCGLLKEGYKADLIVIDINKPNFIPVHNMATNIVYSASGGDIEMTIIDGKIVYDKGDYKTLDFEKVKWNVEKNTEKILKKLGEKV